VLTKSDTVDAETLGVVRLEIEEFLRGTFLEPPDSPIIAVSAHTGDGIERLKNEIIRVGEMVALRDTSALVRLPIDRVFTIKGFGTVITGTLLGGMVRTGDELDVHPGATRVRVRGLQVHGETAQEARAGQRTALNITGASRDELARGMVLAPPGALSATTRLDALLTQLPGSKPLKRHTRMHFHAYTFEGLAGVALLDRAEDGVPIEPNAETTARSLLARIKLPKATLLAPGDRFILRQSSPIVTIGGGIVLDAHPPAKKPEGGEFLRVMANADPKRTLAMRIGRRGIGGASLQQLIRETGWAASKIEPLLRSGIAEGELRRAADLIVDAGHASGFGSLMTSVIEDFQRENPLVRGIAREELRERLGAGEAVFAMVLAELREQRKIEIDADLVRLAGRGVVMKGEETESKQQIEDAFAVAGLKVPPLADVLAGLRVDRGRAQKIVTLLLQDKVLVKVSPELVFHRQALDMLRSMLAAHKQRSTKLDVAGFKEMTGVSRKYAIPLLEYLDRQHVTRRAGDVREIL